MEEEKVHIYIAYIRRALMLLGLALFFVLPLSARVVTTRYFELDVPEGLEVQGEPFSSLYSTESTDSDFRFVLQQEGLNNLEEEAFNNYCRVIIKVIDTGVSDLTNAEFRKKMVSYTISERNTFYDFMEETFGLSDVIISRNTRDTTMIDNFYTLHLNCERKGVTDEKGDVIVDVYFSTIGGYLVFISASYRAHNEAKSLPMVEAVISSLIFLIKDDGASTPVLYENTLPDLDSLRYKWPEKDPEWTGEGNGIITSETISYESDIDSLEVSVRHSPMPFSRAEMNDVLSSLRDEYLYGTCMFYSGKSFEIIENKIIDNSVYFFYQYEISGHVIYERAYARFIDSERFVSIFTRSFDENDLLIEEIVTSFGFDK